MRFLLDAQLPPGLVGPLMQAGHECVHVTKHLAGDASDMAVAELASALDAVLIIFPRGILKVPRVGVRCGNILRVGSGDVSSRCCPPSPPPSRKGSVSLRYDNFHE